MYQVSTLELLPNEILIDIFEYLPVQDLFKAISGLNSRLTRIINSFQGFRFEQSDFENIDDSAFADYIMTLVVRHSNQIDLSRYPKLRALKLEWPSRRQCEQTIRQSHLEHLHVGHAYSEFDTDQLLRHIFTNGFPQLRSCHMENLVRSSSIINRTSAILPTLNSIKIFTLYSKDLPYLLWLCPNLRRLSIKFFDKALIDLKTLEQFLLTPHNNLRRLVCASVDQMSIETIDSILTLVPNITYLTIINPQCSINKIDVAHMGDSLHRRLRYLCQFYANIWLHDLASDIDDIEVIQTFHPLFNQVRLSSAGGRLIISSTSSSRKKI
jgi:hypothetical protein